MNPSGPVEEGAGASARFKLHFNLGTLHLNYWLCTGTPVKEAVVCEVPYGSLVLFTNMTPHRRYFRPLQYLRLDLWLHYESF